jgi:acetyltransferase-like isoleucine patch superfamily enzyme
MRVAFSKIFHFIQRTLFPLPRQLRLGYGAKVGFPRSISSGQQIRIGENTTIGNSVVLYTLPWSQSTNSKGELEIGANCYVGHHTEIHCIRKLVIGDFAVISSNVYISDVSHGMSPLEGPIMSQKLHSKGAVMISNNAFIGNGAMIMPGVIVGSWAVVGANTVVTKSVEPFTMVAGNPAKTIKIFDHEKGVWCQVD